jgi:glucose/arabinose dehydrogenase
MKPFRNLSRPAILFRSRSRSIKALALAVVLTGCGASATIPIEAGIGPAPALPAPKKSLIPTIKVAQATGWTDGRVPASAAGLKANAFATGLEHPRWLLVLPNGDVLVAEASAPPKPPGTKPEGGIRGWYTRRVFKKVGSAVPSANRITLLRDTDGDGVAEIRSTLIDSLMSPFGMALVGEQLYIANADAIVRVPFKPGTMTISAKPVKVFDLPSGINHHWTKNIIASKDGSKLYATVGSNSNVAEKGMEIEEGRAAIWEVDVKTGKGRLFATGLRNPNGMAWEPTTGALWTVVNERDELGSDLVPDYLTSVKEGAFYGWPYSYYGSTVDDRVKPPRPDLVAKAIAPDYALGPHVAALGLVNSGTAMPAPFRNGMFIGLHGSWNRKPPSGYKVVFIPFANGRPNGSPIDVLTGFMEDGKAYGRPVGVAIDRRGALLVADDVGNTIWRVAGMGTVTASTKPDSVPR